MTTGEAPAAMPGGDTEMHDDALVVRPAARLRGSPALPGDKSISHRALLLALLAEGESTIASAGDGEDVRSTAGIVAALGATVERTAVRGGRVDYRVVVPGRRRARRARGRARLRQLRDDDPPRGRRPRRAGRCSPSSTATRRSAGARWAGSRSRSPAMGAAFAGRASGTLLPLAITGRARLTPIRYDTPGPQRPGQVRGPARRARGRGRDGGDRGGRDARPHGADAPRAGHRRGGDDRARRRAHRPARRPGPARGDRRDRARPTRRAPPSGWSPGRSTPMPRSISTG